MGLEGSKTTTTVPPFEQTTAIAQPRSSTSGQKKNRSASDTAQSNHRSSHQFHSRIIENFMIIWLDVNINELNRDNQKSISQLRRIVHFVKIFTNSDHCIDYLVKVKDEKIFLIVSASLESHVFSLFSNMSQLASIYIFGRDNFQLQQGGQECRKVKGAFTEMELMCAALNCDVRQFERALTPMSITPPLSATDLNEINPSFLYSQLFKTILLDSKFEKKDGQAFVDFYRVHYANNVQALRVIDEFERKYLRPLVIDWCTRPTPIWWYTREYFIDSLLNKALRIQDVEMIIKMGFFIQDLHREIEQLHSRMTNHHALIVYRGQGMLHADFENMKKSIGGLLSFDSFLLTSTDLSASLHLARCARENADLTAILFQMEINPSISTTPFVSLDTIRDLKNAEKAILFSMHTVFDIGEIKLIDDRLWQVNLILSSNNEEQLTHLTQSMRDTTTAPASLHRITKLMYQMGDFFKAEKIYTTLLETTSDDDRQQLAVFHHQLGYTLQQKGDLASALSHYQQSLNIYSTFLSVNDPRLGPTYTSIGHIFRKQGDLEGALEHFQRALDIGLQASSTESVEIATRYSNIGGVFKDQGSYDDALKSYACALETYLVHLSPQHPFLAITYSNIGLVHNSMGDHASALSYYEKTLESQQRSLPFDHPSLAITHNNMAYALEDLSRTQEAIKHAERAVNISCRSFGPNHSQVQENQRHLDELRRLISSSAGDTDA